MPRSAQRRHQQMNLPLRTVDDHPVVSGHRQQDLTRMLVERLLSAAHTTCPAPRQDSDDDLAEADA